MASIVFFGLIELGIDNGDNIGKHIYIHVLLFINIKNRYIIIVVLKGLKYVFI